MCYEAEEFTYDKYSFINHVRKNPNKHKISSKNRIRLHSKLPPTRSFDETTAEIDKLLRTKDSKTSYNTIKALTILQPEKRDGDIMKCILNPEGKIITNNNDIMTSCLE